MNRETAIKGRPETGKLASAICFGSQVSAIRSQVQAIRCRYGCGKIQVLNLHPNLKTRTRLPISETRDLKISAAANPPVSGFPSS